MTKHWLEAIWLAITFEGKCPHCNTQIKVGIDDVHAVRFDALIFKCPHCGKTFIMETNEVFLATEE